MIKKLTLILVLLALTGLIFATGTSEKKEQLPWKPTKPIQIIVPWSAGGSTDQVTRVVAGELEDHLGQKIVIVNQPGASGSVGTKSCLDAPHDGYTWAAGAAADLGGYKVLGFLDTTLKDWELYLDVANVAVVSVNPKTPYKTFDDLLKAFKEKPGQISVATAGQSSAGHNAIEAIRKFTGIEYKHVTYDGGNPAVIAAVAGETEVVTQLAVEQADMLRGKKLRALAVLSPKALELKGYGSIPSINKWIPKLVTAPNYFGIWIPKDAPKEVIETFGILWDTVIPNSQKLKDYAAERGAVFDPSWGDKAKENVFPFLQQVLWVYYDAGKAKMSPEVIGVPRPQ
ncbi:MAG: tripartite tricarboxylate transporter substrate binding protein [Spirochaetes bacterium]|nr:MAG: tripartite tricarboxylate transporter substrate binding protein [Spirochaetota bacterium]